MNCPHEGMKGCFCNRDFPRKINNTTTLPESLEQEFEERYGFLKTLAHKDDITRNFFDEIECELAKVYRQGCIDGRMEGVHDGYKEGIDAALEALPEKDIRSFKTMAGPMAELLPQRAYEDWETINKGKDAYRSEAIERISKLKE